MEDIEEAAKCAGSKEFLANSTTAPKSREEAVDEVRSEMAAKMGKSFDALAMAAEASKATYEEQAHTIATLTASNAELAATVKKNSRTKSSLCQKSSQQRLSPVDGAAMPRRDLTATPRGPLLTRLEFSCLRERTKKGGNFL